MDATVKMELFQNLFYVSTAIMLIGFGLAIFFFFFFDIRNVRALMTGKAKREVIQRMTEQNARTGSLRGPVTGSTRDPSVPMIQHPSQVVTEDIAEQTVPPADQAETTVLANNEETTILTSNEETTILRGSMAEPAAAARPEIEEGAGETTILSAQSHAAPAIRFDVTESTIVIHTNEII